MTSLNVNLVCACVLCRVSFSSNDNDVATLSLFLALDL